MISWNHSQKIYQVTGLVLWLMAKAVKYVAYLVIIHNVNHKIYVENIIKFCQCYSTYLITIRKNLWRKLVIIHKIYRTWFILRLVIIHKWRNSSSDPSQNLSQFRTAYLRQKYRTLNTEPRFWALCNHQRCERIVWRSHQSVSLIIVITI